MTPEQLNVAKNTQQWHSDKFGFSNVELHLGSIEKLDALNIAPESVDIIISNCVINLCPDKASVIKGCVRLLKQGGEMYFSDVYATTRVTKALQDDPVLWGECISGALYYNDFLNIARQSGFSDPRLMTTEPITIRNREKQAQIAAHCPYVKFFSATLRLFKIDELDLSSEDHGQAVVYKGGIPDCPSSWGLDEDTVFPVGKVVPVSGNTFRMLKQTRFNSYFDLIGSFDRHFGPFGQSSGESKFFMSEKVSAAKAPLQPLQQMSTAASSPAKSSGGCGGGKPAGGGCCGGG
eukprot:Selendium_serpulae@DN11711_c0_g1_i1.p1